MDLCKNYVNSTYDLSVRIWDRPPLSICDDVFIRCVVLSRCRPIVLWLLILALRICDNSEDGFGIFFGIPASWCPDRSTPSQYWQSFLIPNLEDQFLDHSSPTNRAQVRSPVDDFAIVPNLCLNL